MPDRSPEQVLKEIQQIAQEAHSWSEADTCDKIILRLLREIGGYDYFDYVAQEKSNAGIPDYTILHGSSAKWFLEAKRYGLDLNHDLAIQVLNYANAQGVRWVVLSNGRQWWLYDQFVNKPVDGKFVIGVDLFDTQQMLEFLKAIGKQSMLSGEIERYVKRVRLEREIRSGLTEPTSDLIQAVVKRLKKRIDGLTAQDVVDCIRNLLRPTTSETVGIDIVDKSVQPESYSLTELAQRAKELAMGRKPLMLYLPDRKEEVTSWRQVVVSTILWLDSKNCLPAPPCPRSQGSKRYMYHNEPKHFRTDMIHALQIKTSRGLLFIETNMSADELLNGLVYLCERAGQDPSQIRIAVEGGQSSEQGSG